LNPVELGLKPLKLDREAALDYLLKHRKEIEALLGVSLAKDRERIWNTYITKVRSIRKSFKELCHDMGENKLCLYQYKDISAKEYLRTPMISAMRGTVLEWYPNGEAKVRAFPFAKFFNYGEVPETRELPRDGFIATEKLDGTLVVVWRDEEGQIHANTRGLLEWYGVQPGKTKMYVYKSTGIVNPYVKAFFEAVKRLDLKYELDSLVGDNVTVMFELVGRIPASQAARGYVEIDPSDPSWTPYALAIRDNKTYELRYVEPSTAFPTPKRYGGKVEELHEFVKEWRDKEGIVLYYPSTQYREGDLFRWWNYMVKLKSARYVLRTEIFLGDKLWWRGIARSTILGYHDDIIAVTGSAEVKEFVEKVLVLYNKAEDLWMKIIELMRSGCLTEARRNYIANNMNMKWIIPYLEEGRRRGEGALRRMLIENLPRTKDGIVSFMGRIVSRLSDLYNAIKC
jgi:hypothetical protein